MCAGTAAADPMGTALSSCGPGRIEFAFTFQRMLTMAEIVAKATPPTAIKYPNREETRRAIFNSVKLRSLPE